MASWWGDSLTEVDCMPTEGERVYDPQLGKIITRLKTAQQLQQECAEKNRCISTGRENP